MNRETRVKSFWLAVLLVASVCPSGVWATPARASQADRSAAPTEELARLKSSVVAAFEVLPARSSVMLVPRAARAGVQSIEVGDGTVAINGTLVTGAELRQRLGSAADLVVALSYLEPERRRTLLFGSGSQPAMAPPIPPEPEAPAAAPPEIPTPEAPPETPRERRHFVRQVETRIRVGGNVHVPADERVSGPVVVIGGSADIDGRVDDAVVVVAGSVRLGPEAEVRNDITVVGGTLERADSAAVLGEVHIIGIDFPPFAIRPLHPDRWLPWFALRRPLGLVGTALRFALVGLLLLATTLFFCRGVERVSRTVAAVPWKAGLVGLIAELLLLPMIALTVIVLIISIVGIPLLLLVPIGILVIVVGLFLGLAGVASAVGRLAETRFGWARQATFICVVIGLVLIWVPTLLGRILGLAGMPLWPVSVAIVAAGALVEYVAWTVGFGAVLLSRFGRREPTVAWEPASPVPPSPSGPPDTDLGDLQR